MGRVTYGMAQNDNSAAENEKNPRRGVTKMITHEQRNVPMPTPTIVFNTANLVARVAGYRFKLSTWGQQHEATAKATDDRAWDEICGQIAAAGYRAVEVWAAHVDPRYTDEAKARRFVDIMKKHNLKGTSFAGWLTPETAKVCQWMGLAAANGGMPADGLPNMRTITQQTGLRFHYENHPEKSAQAIHERVQGGDDRIGVCIDTGWLGTQGVNAPEAIATLGSLVRHVHVKDVRAAGAHETVPLGTGCVDLPGVFRQLKAIGYRGELSWEDEPEDRNPFDIAAQMRTWIERTWDAS